MISPTEAADFLPPTFQILTGLSFAALLIVRFLASSALKPLWGKIVAFSLIFIALGCYLMSVATARSSLDAAAEFLTLGGISYFLAAILVVVGLVAATRSAGASGAK